MDTRPLSWATRRTVPRQCSWVAQRRVRERSIEQLSPEACALSLLLVTVAKAQGRRFDSEPSLCQRLAMAPADDEEPVDRKAVVQPLWEVLSGSTTPVCARAHPSMPTTGSTRRRSPRP